MSIEDLATGIVDIKINIPLYQIKSMILTQKDQIITKIQQAQIGDRFHLSYIRDNQKDNYQR